MTTPSWVSHRSYYAKNPVNIKVERAIETCSLLLPMRLATRISMIRFGPQGVIDPMFEVVFMGGHVITFPDIERFPSDDDLARIAIECPS